MSVPTPPIQHARQRRHSTQTMATAQRMHAAGWTPTQLVRYFAGQDLAVAESTVRRWVIPAEAEGQREHNRACGRARRARGPAALSMVAVMRHARLKQLRAGGLTFTALAIVARIDFDLDFNSDQMRHLLRGNLTARKARRLTEATA